MKTGRESSLKTRIDRAKAHRPARSAALCRETHRTGGTRSRMQNLLSYLLLGVWLLLSQVPTESQGLKEEIRAVACDPDSDQFDSSLCSLLPENDDLSQPVLSHRTVKGETSTPLSSTPSKLQVPKRLGFPQDLTGYLTRLLLGVGGRGAAWTTSKFT